MWNFGRFVLPKRKTSLVRCPLNRIGILLHMHTWTVFHNNVTTPFWGNAVESDIIRRTPSQLALDSNERRLYIRIGVLTSSVL